MIQRRVPSQGLAERRHRANLDAHHLRRAALHGGHQPALQAFGEIAHRIGERTRDRAQHVRYQHLHQALVELVVDRADELLHRRTAGQRVQFVLAQELLLLAFVGAGAANGATAAAAGRRCTGRRAPELAPQLLDGTELQLVDGVQERLAMLAVHAAQCVHVVGGDLFGVVAGRLAQLHVQHADVRKVAGYGADAVAEEGGARLVCRIGLEAARRVVVVVLIVIVVMLCQLAAALLLLLMLLVPAMLLLLLHLLLHLELVTRWAAGRLLSHGARCHTRTGFHAGHSTSAVARLECAQPRRGFHLDAVVVVFAVAARAQPTSSQPGEHRPYQLTETGRVHCVQLVLGAVVHVVIVERGARQTDALRILVVVHQPGNGRRRDSIRVRQAGLAVGIAAGAGRRVCGRAGGGAQMVDVGHVLSACACV